MRTEDKLLKNSGFDLSCEIGFEDGGTISNYVNFMEISETWNHFLFEPLIDEDYQTFFIDFNQELIQYYSSIMRRSLDIQNLMRN